MSEWIYSSIQRQLDRVLRVVSSQREDFRVFFCKCLDRQRWNPQFDTEGVTSQRARNSKVFPTDCSPCTWHNDWSAVCRPQMPPANDGWNGNTHVGQVGRRQTVKAFVGDHSQAEGNSLAVDWHNTAVMITMMMLTMMSFDDGNTVDNVWFYAQELYWWFIKQQLRLISLLLNHWRISVWKSLIQGAPKK